LTLANDAIAALQWQMRMSHDFKTERLSNGGIDVDLFYYSSLCDKDTLFRSIGKPLLTSASDDDFRTALRALPDLEVLHDMDTLAEKLLAGHAAILFEGSIHLLNAKITLSDKPMEPSVETTLQGPQTALSESIETNLTIVRQRYPAATLFALQKRVGRVSQTKLSILFDEKVVDRKALQMILERIDRIDADIVQSVGQLEMLISDKKIRLFPVMLITERPDRIVQNLANGHVVILIDGSPFAAIAPAVLYDFLAAMDDLYQTYWVSRFLLGLRYIALFLTLSLPAIYVAIVSYNPEIFRVQFTLSIAGSRAAVPYPSYIEVLIMLFIVEALLEASLRLPRFIGGTATTVGGLILGQAAQQAGLVSSIMIIITSTVAISNFVIPITMMSFAFRIMKYPLIVLAACFGMYGLIVGLFLIVMYLCEFRSFGRPYLQIFVGEKRVSGVKGTSSE